MPKKYEKGDCYVECLAQTNPILNREPRIPLDEPTLRIVHGRPKLTRPSWHWYGHAWLEWELAGGFPLVYDVNTHSLVPRDAYYEGGNIDPSVECFRYTVAEAKAMMDEYEHYGPWEGIEGCPPL